MASFNPGTSRNPGTSSGDPDNFSFVIKDQFIKDNFNYYTTKKTSGSRQLSSASNRSSKDAAAEAVPVGQDNVEGAAEEPAREVIDEKVAKNLEDKTSLVRFLSIFPDELRCDNEVFQQSYVKHINEVMAFFEMDSNVVLNRDTTLEDLEKIKKEFLSKWRKFNLHVHPDKTGHHAPAQKMNSIKTEMVGLLDRESDFYNKLQVLRLNHQASSGVNVDFEPSQGAWGGGPPASAQGNNTIDVGVVRQLFKDALINANLFNEENLGDFTDVMSTAADNSRGQGLDGLIFELAICINQLDKTKNIDHIINTLNAIF